MDAFTRHQLAEVHSLQEDEDFAVVFAHAQPVRDFFAQFHRFQLLDVVFEDFLSSNKHQGRKWTLTEMLQSVRTSRPGKQFFYSSSTVPYSASVWLYEGELNCLLNALFKFPLHLFSLKTKKVSPRCRR